MLAKGKSKGKNIKLDNDALKKFTNQYDGALDSTYYI